MYNNLNMKIKFVSPKHKIPTKAHENDACFDIYAYVPDGGFIEIPPHTTKKIRTGFATEIPKGYWAAVFARSGLASKCGLRPAQGVPVIDEPYRGEWMIPIHNDTDETQCIHDEDRIAQFMLLPYYHTDFEIVDTLSETDRGEGGFGSSGK